MAELPIARGLFLCERVIVEETTRNVSLINCFTRLVVDSFPSPPQSFSAFAILTNGNGTMPLRLTVSDPKEQRELLDIIGVMTFTDPLHILRPMILIRQLVFPTAGKYEIVLDSDGEFLAQTQLEMLTTGS